MITQRIKLQHAAGDAHILRISVQAVDDSIELLAAYESGTLGLPPNTQVTRWPVEILLPAGSDPGHVWIGSGRIDIDVPELKGLGLGSLFMSVLVPYLHKQPNLRVAPIDLSVDDARSPAERERRNRFYERLGFSFDYQGNGEWGRSRPIYSHDLIAPDPRPRNGWNFGEP